MQENVGRARDFSIADAVFNRLVTIEDLKGIAAGVVDRTRVVTDAAEVTPGRAVHVEVVPGFAEQPLLGTLQLKIPPMKDPPGQPLEIDGVLRSPLTSVTIDVAYTVTRNGAVVPPDEWVLTSRQKLPTGSDPPAAPMLEVDILLRPPVIGEADTSASYTYSLGVEVTATVSAADALTVTAGKLFTVPVRMPALRFPGVLLLGKHANFSRSSVLDGVAEPGSLAVILEPGSPSGGESGEITLRGLLAKLDETLQELRDLGPVLGWSAGGEAVAEALSEVITTIRQAPEIATGVGNISDLSRLNLEFQNQASSLMLVGRHETTVTLYRAPAYGSSHKTLEARSQPPFPPPIGVVKVGDFRNVSWDDDPTQNLDDLTQSIYWGSAIH